MRWVDSDADVAGHTEVDSMYDALGFNRGTHNLGDQLNSEPWVDNFRAHVRVLECPPISLFKSLPIAAVFVLNDICFGAITL